MIGIWQDTLPEVTKVNSIASRNGGYFFILDNI
jgi:hypothetical protein